MCPDSYSFWATCIVRETEYPNFLLASCCNVDVVKGAAGERFAGLVSNDLTSKSAPIQSCKNFSASSCLLKRSGNSALKASRPLPKMATILNAASDLNLLISRSLSTISLTATDCTRPAESDGFTFFHNTGESSKPTNLSNTRRACCALTKL